MVKDKITHRSKGVAFVLFLERESAYKCIRALNGTQVFKGLFTVTGSVRVSVDDWNRLQPIFKCQCKRQFSEF